MVIAVQRDFGFGSWICGALFTRAIAVSSLIHPLVLYRPVFYSLYISLTILPQTVFPTKVFYLWFIEGSVVSRAFILFYVYSYCRCCRSQVCVGVSEVQTSHQQPSAAQPPILCTQCIRAVLRTASHCFYRIRLSINAHSTILTITTSLNNNNRDSKEFFKTQGLFNLYYFKPYIAFRPLSLIYLEQDSSFKLCLLTILLL
jgi:hypothetical protein